MPSVYFKDASPCSSTSSTATGNTSNNNPLSRGQSLPRGRATRCFNWTFNILDHFQLIFSANYDDEIDLGHILTFPFLFPPPNEQGRPGEGVPGVLPGADPGLQPVDELLAVEGEHPEVVGIPLRTARGGQGIRVAVQVRLKGGSSLVTSVQSGLHGITHVGHF